jgi:hypothetical protein
MDNAVRLILCAMLLLLAGALSGFYFDRWLHRPIVIQTTELCGTKLPV